MLLASFSFLVDHCYRVALSSTFSPSSFISSPGRLMLGSVGSGDREAIGHAMLVTVFACGVWRPRTLRSRNEGRSMIAFAMHGHCTRIVVWFRCRVVEPCSGHVCSSGIGSCVEQGRWVTFCACSDAASAPNSDTRNSGADPAWEQMGKVRLVAEGRLDRCPSKCRLRKDVRLGYARGRMERHAQERRSHTRHNDVPTGYALGSIAFHAWELAHSPPPSRPLWV